MSVMKPSKVNMQQILFREAKKVVDKDNKKIGLRVPIYYKNNDNTMQKFLVQTPKMKVPFGLSSFEGKNFMIGPQFTGFRDNFVDNKEIQQMYNFMEQLTLHITNEIKKNIVEWFGKGYDKFDNEQIKTALMWPILKMSEDNKYDPTMKIKFPSFPDNNSDNIVFTTKVFNKERELITINAEFPMETIPKFSDVKLIMHVSDLFVGSSKASLTIKAEQVMVYPPETFLKDCAFLDDDDDVTTTNADLAVFDEDSDESNEDEDPKPQTNLTNPTNVDESSDEESEEEESEEESEPTPPPTPTKRGRKKLKKPE